MIESVGFVFTQAFLGHLAHQENDETGGFCFHVALWGEASLIGV
jgi:hypothetical protein